jgi:cysteine desulfurase
MRADPPIYLDHNSTTPPAPGVVDAITRAQAHLWANPSSVHRAGQDARRGVELARESLARLLGVRPRDLVLCSSGTESIGMALRGVLTAPAAPGTAPGTGRVLITTAVEHAAVRDLAEQMTRHESVQIRHIPLLDGGVADAAALPAMLDDVLRAPHPPRVLVSVQWANNETGVIHPVREIGAACRARNALFHCDATQWIGKMPAATAPALDAWCDFLTFSPHKFGGPKGVGCLWIRRGVPLRALTPGSQELGRRAGTENVPGVIGAGIAAEHALSWLAHPEHRELGARRRDTFERAVVAAYPEASINGLAPGVERLWNTTNIAFPRLEAEVLLLMLSERGVYASAGAACSSGSLDPSPVLLAMGIPRDAAHGSLRFSLGHTTADDELARAAEIITRCAHELRRSL